MTWRRDTPEGDDAAIDTEPEALALQLAIAEHMAEQARETIRAKTQERDAALAELARLDAAEQAEAAREQRRQDEAAAEERLKTIARALVVGNAT